MLSGFIFFSDGGVQMVGDVKDYTHIISSMEIILNRLKSEIEDKRRLGQYQTEDLKRELERRNEL